MPILTIENIRPASVYKVLLKPLSLTILIFAALAVAVNTAYTKITEQQEIFNQSVKNEQNLLQKVNKLTQLDKQANLYTNVLAYAYPEDNPALVFLSQLKTIAVKESVVLGEISIKKSDTKDDGSATSTISLTVLGDIEKVFQFLKSIRNYTPLSTLAKISFDLKDMASVSVSFVVYYAPYPKTIPQITEKTIELNAQDRAVLEKISTLNLPVITELFPEDPTTREEPFN